MKDSEIVWQAIKRLNDLTDLVGINVLPVYSCECLYGAGATPELVYEYSSLMAPGAINYRAMWLNGYFPDIQSANEWRILALTLFHAMLVSDGR